MDTLFVGQEFHKIREMASTNAYLKNLCRNATLSEGYTIMTEYQTSGRGQIGNSWESEAGKNLLISVLLKPTFLEASDHFLLNMSVCLATADTLNHFHRGFQIKWPNDLIFDRAKTGGILIENMISGRTFQSIVGIGLNINQSNFRSTNATSLSRILSRPIHLDFVLENLLSRLEVRYLQLKRGEVKSIYADYLQLLYGYGQEVCIMVNGMKKNLEITGVENSGRLIGVINHQSVRFNFKELTFKLY